MGKRLTEYLRDPFLQRLHRDIRHAGPLRSVSVDLTQACNLRCTGCYYFEEGMDAVRAADPAAAFDDFLDREEARGTNFITVVGGEPSLEPDRLRKIHDRFRASVATNGLRRIPREGLEKLSIGVAIWGAAKTDRRLRGGGDRDIFTSALDNYRGDERAFFYYTVAPGRADEVEEVVDRCVAEGHRVLFNFYCDVAEVGGDLDWRDGFGAVRDAIDGAIDRHPGRILMTSRFAEVVSTGRLFGERWGHATCTSISADHEVNAERIKNGKPYNPHFRAYNADFATTRRCCTGIDRSCDSCFDVWEHFSWVTLNLRKHLGSKDDFTSWLATTWLFYFISRLVDIAPSEEADVLSEIHRRTRLAGSSSVT